MKHFYILLLLCFGLAQSQVINIPDANFKNKLIAIGVDANTNGEIEQSEALMAPTYLSLNEANIGSLEGIQYFTNTTYLVCSGNHIASLDVTALVNLVYLDCHGNFQLANLNVSGLSVLDRLECGHNALTTVNLSGLTALREFIAASNSLTSVDLAGLANMETIDVSFNSLTALDISDLPNLRNLDFMVNAVTSIDVSTAPHLYFLRTSMNPIGSLDLSATPEIVYLDCVDNQLSELNISNLSLARLTCADNQLTAIDFTGLDISEMDISNNLLTEINVNGMDSLNNFICGGNLVTTLDLSGVTHLNTCFCQNSPYLTNLNVRNGSDEIAYSFAGCPLLSTICADESDLVQVREAVTNAGLSQCVVESYCVFTPAGDYNTIAGTVRFDSDNNGCDSNDVVFNQMRIGINDGTDSGSVFTVGGEYSVHVQRPDITLAPILENPTYFNVSPPSANVNFTSNNFSTQQHDFCITANGIHNDFEIIVTPVDRPRPGFNHSYEIIYHNKGNQLISGEVVFEFDDTRMDLVSTTVTPTSQSFGELHWNYINLLPFESRKIIVTVNVNGPMESPAVNIGDGFESTATITAFFSDEMPEDNSFTLPEIVMGSFDPNEKICLQGTSVSPGQIGKYLHYRINFENTGTAEAENVVVRDMIDIGKYDIQTLQVMGASHPMATRITNNKVEFIYEGINLGAGEHGYVTFKIKTKSTLAVGSSVSNKADIFFDYNFPVETDPAVTVFSVLGRDHFEVDNSVLIVPNPATDFVTVSATSEIKSIVLFDLQGRNLSTQLSSGVQAELDITSYPKGIYFLKISTAKGSSIQKLIRN